MSELKTDIDKARDRMHKLLALAQQGVGDEAGNARRMLDKLLATHGMTEADLIGEQKPESVLFVPKSKDDKRLVVAVLHRVLDAHTFDVWSRRGYKGFEVMLTKAQHVEVEVLLSVYRPALVRHIEAAFIAFVYKNKIQAATPAPASDDEGDKPAKPEKLPAFDVKAVIAMMGATAATPVHKQIGSAL